jgi:hypothetical protein
MNDKFAAKIAAELHDIAQTLKLIQQAMTRPASPPANIRPDRKNQGQPDAA